MKQNKLLSLTALVLIISLIVPFNVNATTVTTDDGWTLLEESSDEFNGTSLDLTKWNIGLWYDVTSALAFKDENVLVRDGKLVLTAKKESYNGKEYTCGAVESKFEVPGTDCYVEVRAKALDKDANVLSAIWLQSSPLTSAMNPNPEIDIMETVDYSKMSSTLHTWSQTTSGEVHQQCGTNNYSTGYTDISDDYHTYSVERSDGKLRFYFDRSLAWEKDAPDASFTEMARHMVLSLEGHLGAPVDSMLPSEFLIDYVRTYYHSDFSSSPSSGTTYKIVNRNSGFALSVSTSASTTDSQLIQSQSDDTNLAKWVLNKNSDNTYAIQNVETQKVITLTSSQNIGVNGNTIIQSSNQGLTNQRWYIVPIGNGYFKIMSMISGKALVVLNASSVDGAQIIQWSYEGSDVNDEWIFQQCD